MKLENLEMFWYYLAVDITANSICKIHCLALDGFDFNTVNKNAVKRRNLGKARIRTLGCWVGSKNASLCSKIIENSLERL